MSGTPSYVWTGAAQDPMDSAKASRTETGPVDYRVTVQVADQRNQPASATANVSCKVTGKGKNAKLDCS